MHTLNNGFSVYMHNSCKMIKFPLSMRFVVSCCFMCNKACVNVSSMKHKKITVIPVKVISQEKNKQIVSKPSFFSDPPVCQWESVVMG